MKEFFKVTPLEAVFEFAKIFPQLDPEEIKIEKALNRIVYQDVVADFDHPNFCRSTMDGYATDASSTYGATEFNPSYLNIVGKIEMGEFPDFTISPGECAQILTGGMLPPGADGVVMIEHTEAIDEHTIEVSKTIAPGQNMIHVGEDFHIDECLIRTGTVIRPQEIGLLAALGRDRVQVCKKPKIAIISTGDEIVPIHHDPKPGQIRDVNTYTMSGLVEKNGGIPASFGIIKDSQSDLIQACESALENSDIVLISGGSSVGYRDYTLDAIKALPNPEILVHGIDISPGKPTIIAKSDNTSIWGLPGHIVSAMIVFEVIVKKFIAHIQRSSESHRSFLIKAELTRNISSAHGRNEYIRVSLSRDSGQYLAHPIVGKSGLIHTMVKADGLLKIGKDVEGIKKGELVDIILFKT